MTQDVHTVMSSLYQVAGTQPYVPRTHATTSRQFKPDPLLAPQVKQFKPDPLFVVQDRSS